MTSLADIFGDDEETPPPSPSRISHEPSSDAPEPPSSDAILDDTPSMPVSTRRRQRSISEDLGQLATFLSRQKKFKPAEQTLLATFSTKNEREMSVYLMAEVLAMRDTVSKLTPAEGSNAIMTTSLKQLIDVIVFERLVDPNISGYLGNAIGKAEEALCKSPSFPSELQDDPASWKIVTKQIKARATDFRYSIKRTIFESVYAPLPSKKIPKKKKVASQPEPTKTPSPPPDNNEERANLESPLLDNNVTAAPTSPPLTVKFIKLDQPMGLTDLTAVITKLCAANTTVKSSLELAARIAFLRKVLTDNICSELNFWDIVDQELEATRQTSAGDSAKLWRGYRRIIKLDMQAYGDCDLPLSNSGNTYY